jgi:hypothetical protein
MYVFLCVLTFIFVSKIFHSYILGCWDEINFMIFNFQKWQIQKSSRIV